MNPKVREFLLSQGYAKPDPAGLLTQMLRSMRQPPARQSVNQVKRGPSKDATPERDFGRQLAYLNALAQKTNPARGRINY